MVLEARENAEKVGYPIVGEEVKDASNVIDYNINEEITIDNSSVFNANNDTTTGMANIIPGVNAPKLIQSTSIYTNVQPLTGGAKITAVAPMIYPGDENISVRNWTISGEYGTIKFENANNDDVLWNGLIIPTEGWYQLYLEYPFGGSNYAIDVSLRIAKGGFGNDIHIVDYIGKFNTVDYTATIKYHFNAGDVIYVYQLLHYVGTSSTFYDDKCVAITITKL